MNSSRLFADAGTLLVADASVVINLNATGHAEEIIAAIGHQVLITENAIFELERGRKDGHSDAENLKELMCRRAICCQVLGDSASKVYEELVSGPASLTLDDGEAATIGLALEVCGIALIDERKARSLCSTKYPLATLVSTAELLVHDRIKEALGESGQVEAIFAALQIARMRVPGELHGEIIRIIGPERAAQCRSLPRTVRGA